MSTASAMAALRKSAQNNLLWNLKKNPGRVTKTPLKGGGYNLSMKMKEHGGGGRNFHQAQNFNVPAQQVSGGGGGGGGGGGSRSPKPSYVAPKPKPLPPPPDLDLQALNPLPELALSDETSVEHQLNRLSSKDSNLRQQALINAQERGVASGAIHGSQQAGAAERAVLDVMSSIADKEATRETGQEITNWKQEGTRLKENWLQDTNERVLEYQNKYGERMSKLGLDNSLKLAKIQANTSLSTAMLASTTSLLNNTDLDLSQSAMDKIRDIVGEGQEFNVNTQGFFSYG